MSQLEEKLNHAETLTRKILDSEIDYGSESFILKLIAALRKALKQRNRLRNQISKHHGLNQADTMYAVSVLDAEILQILEGE